MDSRTEVISDPTSPSARADDQGIEPRDDEQHPPARTFQELFRAEFGGMVALARLLGSDDPENTTQEAFVRLHDRWGTLRDPATAIGYLRTTVVRLSRNRLRHVAVVRRHLTRARVDEPASTESAESDALQRADVLAVRSALGRLAERRRAALVLRYYTDLSYQEIAATLRCPAATARSHVRRGLAELARLLGERPDGIEDGGEQR